MNLCEGRTCHSTWSRNITRSASVYFTLRNDQLSVQTNYTVLIMKLRN